MNTKERCWVGGLFSESARHVGSPDSQPPRWDAPSRRRPKVTSLIFLATHELAEVEQRLLHHYQAQLAEANAGSKPWVELWVLLYRADDQKSSA